MNDFIFRAHPFTGEQSPTLVFTELWELFGLMHGNPDYMYSGVRFALGILLSLMFVVIVRMRALHSWELRHFVALIGGCFLLIRYFSMLVFLWGYEIGLYQNQILRFLFPTLDHLFETFAFLCFGYYSIVTTRKGQTGPKDKRFFITIPLVLAFYLYAFFSWQQHFFKQYPVVITRFTDSFVDWQCHFVMLCLATATIVFIVKNVRFRYPLLTYFWIFTALEQLVRVVCYYYRFEPSWLATIFNAVNLWTIPFITLHFVYGYSLHANKRYLDKSSKADWETK